MVYPDLSAPEARPKNKLIPQQAIAFTQDRFVALILDFLVFSPIVSLLISGFVKSTKTYFLINPQSSEGTISAGLTIASIFVLVSFLQSVFLYFWQATPGQLFLQLRVVSYPTAQDRLSYPQCLQRSFFWCLGFVVLAIPFLEILSHPLRRAFHERVSDTMTVTLKQKADEAPHPLEARFIVACMRMTFLFFLFVGGLSFLKTYHSLSAREFKEHAAVTDYACKEIQDSSLVGEARLDTALTLFLLNEINNECLNNEADFALWGAPLQSQGMAYLAKYLVADESTQDQYLHKVCEDSESKTCSLARYLQENGDKEELNHADPQWMVTRLLISEELFSDNNYSGSLKIIADLQKNPMFTTALEKRFVRAVWALKDSSQGMSKDSVGRRPASFQDTNSENWIEEFKERYEIQ